MLEQTNFTPLRHAINAALFVVILAVSFALFSPAASAAPSCGSHEDIVALLGKSYAESQVALGLSANGMVIEVFSTRDGRTWTILATQTDGTTCILSSGEQWIPAIPVSANPA